MKIIILLLSVAATLSCKTHSPTKTFQKSLFNCSDHTAENMFTGNIEGPAINKDGKLFVVNYQRDGTIGWVKEDGSCALFVSLSGKKHR